MPHPHGFDHIYVEDYKYKQECGHRKEQFNVTYTVFVISTGHSFATIATCSCHLILQLTPNFISF
jgi:hypothetical protein